MLAIEERTESGKKEVNLVLVRFFNFGISDKGRGGTLVEFDDKEKWDNRDIRILGYNRFNKWKGPLPEDSEEWTCEIIFMREDGILMVDLIENISKKKEQERRAKIIAQAIELGPIIKHVDHFEGQKEELEPLMLDAIQFFIELKNFAEREKKKKKALGHIKDLISGITKTLAIDFSLLALKAQIYRASEYMSWKNQLRAIVSWLERDENVATFKDKGKRYIDCGCCGTMFRLGGNDYREFKAEKKFVFHCPDCGANLV